MEPEDDLAIQYQGAVRIGEQGTLVAECHLQDMVCGSCAALLGLRCVQTPVNHVLDRNQILLRLASVELLDCDGLEIEFVIKRVLAVNRPLETNKAKVPTPSQGGFTSAFPGTVELQKLQLELHNQREDIKRIDSNGFRIVTALDKRAGRIQADVTNLRGTVPGLQRDIESVRQKLVSIRVEIDKTRASEESSTALPALEGRLAQLTTIVGEVGKQVATFGTQFGKEIGELKWYLRQQEQAIEDLRGKVRGIVFTADYGEDMANLRAEMALMRRQVDEAYARETARSETAFPSRELEALTSAIAKISNRANQVETLQMEVEILKGRVERASSQKASIFSRLLRPPKSAVCHA
ncbi:uncharacterized protein B0H64DRAFT_439350 [Chaetomium fimeti]|uniref:Uncharacterized protein n=1 Tax=Chaetomium fimeti TaxID=1854472 RepID=A0AAE0HNL8_9PEZI|nr:hypothetical protein B0H64DRAFT_439350 [Chaetomium fimeti]